MHTTTARPAPISSPIPAHWIPGQPHAAHFLDAMHMVFPAGERAFCRILGQAGRLVDGAGLQAHIRNFVQQEAHHATAHARAYSHLEVRGKWAARALWLTEAAVAALFGTRPARSRRVLVWRVASVAAIEHLTTELSRWVFQTARFEEAGCDPRMTSLIRWHSAEEVEHRSVAFDTLVAIQPNRAHVVRRAAMLVCVPAFFVVWFACAQALLLDDAATRRKLLLPRRLRKAARAGLLPELPALVRAMAPFFGASYHPAHHVPAEVVTRAEAYLAGSSLANVASS